MQTARDLLRVINSSATHADGLAKEMGSVMTPAKKIVHVNSNDGTSADAHSYVSSSGFLDCMASFFIPQRPQI